MGWSGRVCKRRGRWERIVAGTFVYESVGYVLAPMCIVWEAEVVLGGVEEAWEEHCE